MTTDSPDNQSAEQGTPLHTFLKVWISNPLADAAQALTCAEVDALADLLRSNGHTAAAIKWVNLHARGDYEGDTHHRTPSEALRAEFDELAASVPGLELCEEEPEAFGYGHLVFYKHHEDARIAFTEICDQPSGDPNREVTGYTWLAERRSANGQNVVTASGSAGLDDTEAITAAAWSWATQ